MNIFRIRPFPWFGPRAAPPLDVEAGYARWAADYDTAPNRTRDLDARILRTSGLERAGRDIVELGCGTGKNTLWLAEGARTLTGIDLSEAMLARARERVRDPRVRLLRHDLREPWPIARASTDVVVGNLVLEHIAEVDALCREAARVLRPGGELYLAEFHPYRQLRGGGARLSQAAGDRLAVVVHSVSEYVDAVLRAGFALTGLGEHGDDRADAVAIPRLLVVRARREA